MKQPHANQDPVWEDDQMCFACGPRNADGLHLQFTPWGEQGLQCEYTPEKKYQGYKNIVHGGFLGLLLDEVIANVLWKRAGQLVVTAEITVRLHRPAPVGEKLVIRAQPQERIRSRLVLMHGEIQTADGTLIATAKAKCVKVPGPGHNESSGVSSQR